MNSFISISVPPLHLYPYQRYRSKLKSCSNLTQPNSSVTHPLLNERAAQQHFLQTVWGKTPKLFRNLIPFDNPLDPDDLAALATQVSHARIIRGNRNGPYSLTLGPFTDETFQTLGHKDWTLLVDNINRHVPELSHLLDHFSFLPNWAFDDIMLSYAAPGGTVGPHVDNYDVFLLQGSGRRLWKTSYTPISTADERIVEGLDVRILEGGFIPDEEWILEPGDALYLPPRFPHHGISLDDKCMTYSIGFRAPTVANLLSAWVDHLIETKSLHHKFYRHSTTDLINSIGDPGRISHTAAEQAFALVMNQLKNANTQEFSACFAQEVSQQKTFVDMEPLSVDDGPEQMLDFIFRERQEADEPIFVRQREGSVFTFLEGSDGLSMYIDGERWPVDSHRIAATICDKRCRDAAEYVEVAKNHPTVRDVLRKLLEADLLYVAEFVNE